jgi:hypothetical protein
MTDEIHHEAAPRPSMLERMIGGRPASVAVRLLLLSLVVGFLMTMFGVDVRDIVDGAVELVEQALRDGTGIFGDLTRYVLTGAAIVIPVWIVMRLLRMR